MLVGVISDTHGFYDPRVPPLLEGVEHILHAGDIGSEDIIQRLCDIAPVTAIRGNNDREGPASMHREEELLELGGCRIVLTHIVKVPKEGSAALAKHANDGIDAVVYGHSHRQVIDRDTMPWIVNPGACGRSRAYGGASWLGLTTGSDAWRIAVENFA